MKREIKFRAWDKKFSRMYEYGEKCIGIHYDDWELQRLFENGDEAECAEIDGEIIILMQFTGLKDKQGKEIYEGDILSSETSSRGRVKNPYYVAEWGNAGWKAKGYNGELEVRPNLDFRNDLEIIGNIYENPDLTK